MGGRTAKEENEASTVFAVDIYGLSRIMGGVDRKSNFPMRREHGKSDLLIVHLLVEMPLEGGTTNGF
jgi:hypothetical protein